MCARLALRLALQGQGPPGRGQGGDDCDNTCIAIFAFSSDSLLLMADCVYNSCATAIGWHYALTPCMDGGCLDAWHLDAGSCTAFSIYNLPGNRVWRLAPVTWWRACACLPACLPACLGTHEPWCTAAVHTGRQGRNVLLALAPGPGPALEIG